MARTGYVFLWREVLEKELFKEKPFCPFAAWMWLIMEANWEDKPDRFGDIVKRGEIHTSQPRLADEFGWSRSKVQRFLTRLEAEQRIGQEANKVRSKIRIVNYEQYQPFNSIAGQGADKKPDKKPDKQAGTTEEVQKERKKTVPPIVPQAAKTAYGENQLVLLTDHEFSHLCARHTPERTTLAIEKLDSWINGKRGKLVWFEKNYSGAFEVLNPTTCWIWEWVDRAKDAGPKKPGSAHQQNLALVAELRAKEREAPIEIQGEVVK